MPQPTTITIPTQTFSTADTLALARYRRAAILAGAQEYANMGQSAKHAALKDLNDTISSLEAQLATEADSAVGGMNVLVQFGEAR